MRLAAHFSSPPWSRKLRHALAISLFYVVACGPSGGATQSPMQPPPPPTYEDAFEEFADIPARITAHVEWAAKPIDDVGLLANEIAALRTTVSIDSETFTSMFTAAFKEGKVEVGAEVEGKAEIEAVLTRLKQVSADLQGLPSRVKAASSGIGKLVISSPKLVGKASRELTAELKVATGDGAIKIKGDIAKVKALPNEVKTQAAAAKNVITGLPKQATTATSNLLAAIAGQPFEPLAPIGQPAPALAESEAVVVAEATEPAVEPQALPPPITVGSPPPVAEPTPSPSQPLDEQVLARIKKLRKSAASMSGYGDWLSATAAYEEAIALDSRDPMLVFEAGRAAHEAKDCPRAEAHLRRFVSSADPKSSLAEIELAQKTLGEIKTFDCTARTPDDEDAVVETYRRRAAAFVKEDDWGGAAMMYALAYQRAPAKPLLAYEVGVASWKAEECGDAVDYFYHFVSVADPKAHRKQISQSNKYIDQSEVGKCRALDASEREVRARELYAQAQSLEFYLDYLGAADKYERAYALLPNNHAFEFRIAEVYRAAQRCEEAEARYRSFVSKASDPRYSEDVARSQQVLAQIGASGCANVQLASGPNGSSTAGASPEGSSDAQPPPVGQPGAGSATCSVVPGNGSGGALALGVFVLAALRRRGSVKRREKDM